MVTMKLFRSFPPALFAFAALGNTSLVARADENNDTIANMVADLPTLLDTIDLLVPPVKNLPPPPAPPASSQRDEPTVSPSSQPTMLDFSVQEANFRHTFQVLRPITEFNDDYVILFQALFEHYTKYYAPISDAAEVEDKITTHCTIARQYYVDLRRQLRNKGGELERKRHLKEDGPLLAIDYTMRYESMHYDVMDYPRLFQNWTAHHLDGILDQMEFLEFGVLNVKVPRRIVVSTSSPTIAPVSSTNPSASTSTSSPTTVSTPNEKEPTSSFPISIIISLAFGIPFCLVGLSIGLYCGYYKKKPTIFPKRENVVESNTKEEMGTFPEKETIS